MQRTTPPTGTASPKSTWLRVAVPGQPGAHRSEDHASDARPVTTDTPLPVTDHHVPQIPTAKVTLARQPDRTAAVPTAIAVTPAGLTVTTDRVTGSTGQSPVSDPVTSSAPVGPPGQPESADAAVPEGAGLLAELGAALTRYVILPSRKAEVATVLWIAATHLQPAWQHAPLQRMDLCIPLGQFVMSQLCHEVQTFRDDEHTRLTTLYQNPVTAH